MLDSIPALEKINKKRESFLKKTCQQLGGTIADWKLVNLIEAEAQTIQEFAAKSNLDVSTLSRQIKRATEKNLLKRKPSTDDQRRIYFEITDSGQNFKKYISEALSKYDQNLFKNWSPEELTMFQILINRILKNTKTK